MTQMSPKIIRAERVVGSVQQGLRPHLHTIRTQESIGHSGVELNLTARLIRVYAAELLCRRGVCALPHDLIGHGRAAVLRPSARLQAVEAIVFA
jgi:hypothetical protein